MWNGTLLMISFAGLDEGDGEATGDGDSISPVTALGVAADEGVGRLDAADEGETEAVGLIGVQPVSKRKSPATEAAARHVPVI
jgi:hypothetical protein